MTRYEAADGYLKFKTPVETGTGPDMLVGDTPIL